MNSKAKLLSTSLKSTPFELTLTFTDIELLTFGVVHDIVFSSIKLAGIECTPKEQARTPEFSKFVPFMMTRVPPELGPFAGLIEIGTTVALYIYERLPTKCSPSADTAISTRPGFTAGGTSVHKMSLEESQMAREFKKPMRQLKRGVLTKLLPTTDNVLPPLEGPFVGTTDKSCNSGV
jgi:hypothetical protein